MKNVPEVSVILPTYNRAGTLKRSIQSVLSQSVTSFELIIVDDASKDGSDDVIKSFNDNRIKYLKNEKNLGGAESRNIGIRHAQAKLIAFQDSDDEWRPTKLEKCLYKLHQNENLLGVYSAYWQIKGKIVRYAPVNSPALAKDMTESLLWGNFVGTPTVVMQKEVLNACGGFDKKMPRYQDWELFIRLSSYGNFMFIEEPLILSYYTDNSITSNNLAHQQALELIYKKNQIKIGQIKKLKAFWHALIGEAQMRTGSPLEGRKKIFQSFTLDPLNIRIAVKAFLSVPGNRSFYVNMVRLFQKNEF